MITRDVSTDRFDRITWTVTAFSVAGLLVVLAMNGLVALGEIAHDVVCPEHGWAV